MSATACETFSLYRKPQKNSVQAALLLLKLHLAGGGSKEKTVRNSSLKTVALLCSIDALGQAQINQPVLQSLVQQITE